MRLLRKIEEKKKKQQRQQRNRKMAIGSIGILTGTAAGLLFAPKSGKETRNDIKEKTVQVKDRIDSGIKTSKTKVAESKCKIKEYLENRKNTKETEASLVAEKENIEE